VLRVRAIDGSAVSDVSPDIGIARRWGGIGGRVGEVVEGEGEIGGCWAVTQKVRFHIVPYVLP
jgi:hypothetical protein